MGTANAAIGGTSPYTYLWAPGGGTNLTESGLSAGSYTMTVTDNNGCSVTVSTSITQSSVLNISFNQTNVSCNAGSNGNISATPSGGISPYTYAWSGGGSSAINSGLTAGTYTLNVYDKNGCSGSATVGITQPTELVITTDTVSVNSTQSCNGAASVNVNGGTSPYSYIWNPGGGTNDTIAGKCSGQYCCTITDNNGCVQTVCVTISNVTGIENISNSQSINIYPDPNKGSFTIAGVTQSQTIEVYNALGQEIANSTQLVANGPMYFNISDKTDGLYLIRIRNKDGTLVTQMKIIKSE